jgi:hypothetical protein
MTEILTLEHDLVAQDVDTPGSSPYLDVVDLGIPTGKVAVASGAVVTHVWDATTETLVPVDSAPASSVASQIDSLRISDGPHPSDSTKWRVLLSLTSAQRLRVRAWVSVLGG